MKRQRMRRVMRGVRQQGIGLVVGLGALLAAGGAGAVSISLVAVPPTPSNIQAGNTVQVDIVIAGLGAGVHPSITAFALDIGFTTSVLNFVSFTYGTGGGTVNTTNLLGDPCTLANLDGNCDVILKHPATVASGGVVSPEVSALQAPSVIDAYQPASGVLGTIVFSVHTTGTAVLSFNDVDLVATLGGGAEGPLTATKSGLTLLPPPPPVPEPALLWLLGLPLAGLAGLRARS